MPTNIHIPSVNLSGYLPKHEDKLARDEESKTQRVELLERQKWNTFFHSIQQAFMFISSPLIGAGLGFLISGFTGVGADAASDLKLGLGLIGGASVTTGIAIGANYIGARIHHSAAYDQFEINAQHTGKEVAKAIRQELEGMNQTQAQQAMPVFDNPDAQRSDGKSWLQAESERAANQNHNVSK